MVLPLRTPTINFDVAFSSQVDQQVQYREACFAVKTLFTSASWVVERACDSVSVASSDLWLTAANVVNAAAGSAHSWITMVSPVGWLPNSGQIRVTLDCVAPTPDTTPQIMQVFFQAASYGATGSITARPPAVGTETAALINGSNIIPWTTVVAGRYTTWRTARGDVMMMIKPQGTLEARWAFILRSNDDTDGGGEGDNRFYFFAHDSSSATVMTSVNMASTSSCRGLSPGGSNADVPTAESSIWSVSSWTGGISGGGQTVAVPIDLYSDVAVRGRPLGSLIDIYAIPTSLPAGTLDDAETAQTFRRICIDDVLVYVPTASLPFA
jgi:hypothetical protein